MSSSTPSRGSKKRVFMPLMLFLISALTLLSLWNIANGGSTFDTRGKALSTGMGVIVPVRSNTIDIYTDLTNLSVIEVQVTRTNLRKVKQIESYPSSLLCTSKTLQSMRRTVQLAESEEIACDYIGYFPDRNAGTPNSELSDFLGTLKSAQEIADGYGAKLIVGPTHTYLSALEEENSDIYMEAAGYADAWLIQALSFQVYSDDSRMPLEQFSGSVKRIADLLKDGNPEIELWAHLSVTPGKQGRKDPFTSNELITYIESIESLIKGVRIYDFRDPNRPETLRQVVDAIEGREYSGVDPYACGKHSECGWCGDTCEPVTLHEACPTTPPPDDAKCLCLSGTCRSRKVDPVISPGSKSTGACTADSGCGWCGRACIKSGTLRSCPDVMPPEGSECKCLDQVCKAILGV